tara:strand:- start:78 stop:464 length:387 start_codon:yes stop_codon:yes gene_type:complete
MKSENVKAISTTKIDRILKELAEIKSLKTIEITEMLLGLRYLLNTEHVNIQDAIVQSYEERFRESDPDYCNERISYIENMSFLEQYSHLTEMDDFGLKIVAERMDTNIHDLLELRYKIISEPVGNALL